MANAHKSFGITDLKSFKH